MMSRGEISVFIGMLPAMKTTEPYSPTARAKARAKPVSQAGRSAGRTTRPKVWLIAAAAREAPKVSWYEATTRGEVTAAQKAAGPRVELLNTRVESGMRTIRLR